VTPTEKHNELSREFVMKVLSETKSQAELMVVIESTVLSTMLLSFKAYGLSPAGCVEMVEMAVHQATDRFAKIVPQVRK